MKEIKEVVRRIKCELKNAEWYAEEAVKDREMYPKLSHHYHDMAVDNMKRVDELHAAVAEMIDEVQKSGRVIPQGMMDVWQFEHEMLVEQADDVRYMIDRYK